MKTEHLQPRRLKSLLASFAGVSVLGSELASGRELTVGGNTYGYEYSAPEVIGGTILGIGLVVLGQYLNYQDMREAAAQYCAGKLEE